MILSQVEELQFSLAKGRWSRDWGLPLMSAPSGASVRAWQSPAVTEQQQRRHFKDMVHGLAGLTGTALASAAEDDAVAWEPSKRMHLGERIAPRTSSGSDSDVLSAFLPWESVCTENLQVDFQHPPPHSAPLFFLGSSFLPMCLKHLCWHPCLSHFAV
jgi:hypothetical protein